jgi:ribose 5-phosphate isomerase RpiB
MATEILDAWLSTSFISEEADNIRKVSAIERKYGRREISSD